RRHARVGRRVSWDLLRLRGGTGASGTEIESVVGSHRPLAERPVDEVTGLLHRLAFLAGEPEPGQAAQVVVVLIGRGQHEGRLVAVADNSALEVAAADTQVAPRVEVDETTSLAPIRGPALRLFQGVHDIGDP